MNADQIIIEPVVTEKTNIMRESHKYAFKVNRGANKYQVMLAVNELFDVHPLKCNIVNVSRKPKRVRYRLGYTAVWKKAVVTLPPGEIIPIFEGA
ncbi:MAG: 50S ribosomal protein L23 [Spirochaetes bacterium]|nr:50S ribosomal protein L23 [Spirochaetota bacterium]